MGWKEKEATGEFTPKGNVDALHMVLGKDHSGRVVGKGGVRVGLQKAFGKECVATQSRTALREEAATLRAEITKDVLEYFFYSRQSRCVNTRTTIRVWIDELMNRRQFLPS
ncbi:uncharacterized protein LOC130826450 [Amaranthus tricolor]|uniref:uncharacterized protein LOC130826450 n=1 Tax=Amaranthus tricolor TaxID=29722 RepID=UPI00258780E1|nr:uncharacterized protein LOC130826450 [Amaranthus tricolor]